MSSFLSVTRRYILDWKLKSVMLACSRFKGKNTAEKIRQEYEKTLSCFEIGHKISNIVTDNPANMLKAFNFPMPGFESQSNEDEDENENFVDEFCDLTDTSEDNSSDTFETLPKHTGWCFAHTLQLVV